MPASSCLNEGDKSTLLDLEVKSQKIMGHTTFYRKYRSRNFDEIVGQDHIVQTLKNAISHDRLAHAYIFSGPRGTGKTSMARILAKAINCVTGPTPTPCLECTLCERISKGNSVDVIEIDAASNTGVDNIRVLNEQVNFTPVECRYKLYIIDEAHMLSTGAFNALLKTLEEPPPMTMFILATTEPQKIPVTIHSRCQHLHFRPMSTKELLFQLRHISDNEGLKISDQSLTVVARNAGGSMRDGVSLLDQIFSFKGQEISESDVLLILGATNDDRLIELVTHLLDRDAGKLLDTVITLVDDGINTTQLTQDLVTLMKQVVFSKMNLDHTLDVDDDRKKVLASLAAKAELGSLNHILETVAKIQMELRQFPNPDLLIQVRLLLLVKEPDAILPMTGTHIQKSGNGTVTHQSPQISSQGSVATSSSRAQSSEPQPAKRPASPTPVAQEKAPSPAPAAHTKSDTSISGFDKMKWTTFLGELKKEKHGLYAIVSQATINAIRNEAIMISLKQDVKFFREKIEEESSQELMKTLLKNTFGVSYVIQLYDGSNHSGSEDPASQPVSQTDQAESTTTQTSSTPTQTQILNDLSPTDAKRINQIIDMFNGSLVN